MKLNIHPLAVLSILSTLLIAGCGNTAKITPSPEALEILAASKLNVKVSFYPMYEFTEKVAGEFADVEALIPASIEPHDWEPTAQDMARISQADLLIYNGAGMEGWVEQVKDSTSNSKLITVEASKGLDLLESSDEEEGDHEHGGLDPHVWLDPALAIEEVRTIEAALSGVAPEHAAAFKANADIYVAKLEQLDQEFKISLTDAKRKDFITQHAAFGYLANEYGLVQVPIAGLSPDLEPSASRMSEIVEFAKAHQVKTIFFETLVSSSVADTIAKEIGAKAAVLNPIEGLTEEDKRNNLDYIGIMRQNLGALTTALNE